MCLGLPMRVLAARPGHATVQGRGRVCEVQTALVGEVACGDWLLVFLDSARECITAARAAEVNATLDLLEAALAAPGDVQDTVPAFDLPSRLSAVQMAQLTHPTGLSPVVQKETR